MNYIIRKFNKIYIYINLKAQCHLLSDVILRLRNNIIIMYFGRYSSCFKIKIQIILTNSNKLKIRYTDSCGIISRIEPYYKTPFFSHNDVFRN